jgi:hypothetical protein
MSKSFNIPLHWEIECVEKKYFDKLSGTIVFQQAGSAVDLPPELPRNYETLAASRGKTMPIYMMLMTCGN